MKKYAQIQNQTIVGYIAAESPPGSDFFEVIEDSVIGYQYGANKIVETILIEEACVHVHREVVPLSDQEMAVLKSHYLPLKIFEVKAEAERRILKIWADAPDWKTASQRQANAQAESSNILYQILLSGGTLNNATEAQLDRLAELESMRARTVAIRASSNEI